MRPPPLRPPSRLGVSSSYLDSTPDDAILDEGDQAMDSDPDAWVSDDKPSSPLPSRGGGSSPFMGGRLPRTSQFYSPPSSRDPAVDRSAKACLSLVNDGLKYLLEAFEDRVLRLEPNDPLLEDLIFHIQRMLAELSSHGVLERSLGLDTSGIERHHFLCCLRDVLGEYYPSVACTDGTRAVPGRLDPDGPASNTSAPVADFGNPFQWELDDLSDGGAPPPISKSKARRQRRAKAKLASSLAGDVSK